MRDYYTVRTGNSTGTIEWSFDELKDLIVSQYERFRDEGYFAEAYGQNCVDDGRTIGKMGSNVGLFFTQRLKNRDLWPLEDHIAEYSQNDLFSVIELLYDHVSKPGYSRYHDWDNCGNHYANFDKFEGQSEFRNEINAALKDSEGQKHEFSLQGEIFRIPDSGLKELVKQPLPHYEPDTVENKVEAAIRKFLLHSATDGDRKDAVRTLADVLEYLRPQLGQAISSKDESDLFNIANKFAIRHHNQQQKSNYDQDLFHSWIFYTYLATIHLVLGILARVKAQ